jgi:uncharacterized protein involved in exopolysaccharide biosynthesis
MTAATWYPTMQDLLRLARERWRRLALLSFIGAVAGGGTAFLLPSYYRAGAAFQAESQTPGVLSGALAGLASQFGNLSPNPPSNPQLFADLLTTDAVLQRVARGRYPWQGELVPLAAVYRLDRKPTALQHFLTVRTLRKAMSVDVSVRTGVVRFTVEARTPDLAHAIAESCLTALNAANIALRQARASAEQSFSAGRAEASKRELSSAESALADFYQRNRIVNSPTLQMEESRLRRAVDMAQQVYVQLRLQEEQAAVQAVRNTPAISVIDPPLVPVERSWPKRRAAVLAGLGIGLALGLVRLALRL